MPSAGDCAPAENRVRDPLGNEGDVYRLETCDAAGEVVCSTDVTALPASACGLRPTCLDLRESFSAELRSDGVAIAMTTLHADASVAYYKLLRVPRRPGKGRAASSTVVVGVANASSCGVGTTLNVLDRHGRRGDRYRLEVFSRRDRLACVLRTVAR